MRPRTKQNRIRFTEEETAGLTRLAVKLEIPRAALVRAFVRLGLAGSKAPAAIAELRSLVKADAVKRGREFGFRAREKGSVAA